MKESEIREIVERLCPQMKFDPPDDQGIFRLRFPSLRDWSVELYQSVHSGMWTAELYTGKDQRIYSTPQLELELAIQVMRGCVVKTFKTAVSELFPVGATNISYTRSGEEEEDT